jgi:hypothetical protein
MTAKTTASKKAKGRRLELKVAEALRKIGIDAKRTPLSGAGWMKGDVTELRGQWAHECKNHEKVKLWEFWTQTETQKYGSQKAALHISGNNRPVLTVMSLDDYIHLRACEQQLEELLKERANA